MDRTMAKSRRPTRPPAARTSWDPVAEWYKGMVGEGGHRYHQRYAIPALLNLLDPQPGEQILDIGCGPGVPAPHIADAGARYTGVDASDRLLRAARENHGHDGRFLLGDSRRLEALKELRAAMFDAAFFLLSIQDMDPLDEVLRAAAWAVRDGGRLVIVMLHPCFRVPRQSGWGTDEGRRLRYRRVDRYLTPLPVPMKPYPGQQGVTRSFHRPLEQYVNTLARNGFLLDRLHEIPAYDEASAHNQSRAENLSDREIPLFLGIRARKLE